MASSINHIGADAPEAIEINDCLRTQIRVVPPWWVLPVIKHWAADRQRRLHPRPMRMVSASVAPRQAP